MRAHGREGTCDVTALFFLSGQRPSGGTDNIFKNLPQRMGMMEGGSGGCAD